MFFKEFLTFNTIRIAYIIFNPSFRKTNSRKSETKAIHVCKCIFCCMLSKSTNYVLNTSSLLIESKLQVLKDLTIRLPTIIKINIATYDVIMTIIHE